MKCKLILDGRIKHYGYFDEDNQIGKCCIKEYTKGELEGCYLLFGVSIDG